MAARKSSPDVVMMREAPNDLAAAESASASDVTGGEILRGCAAQDDIGKEHLQR
jgi:hypothetical protein